MLKINYKPSILGRLNHAFALQNNLRKQNYANFTKIQPLANPTPAKIEPLMKSHELDISHPVPVRREFYKKQPLTSQDLSEIPIEYYHRKVDRVGDALAYGLVKMLRFFADSFFRKRYVHRAVVLETVAAVPGMVAGMFRHLRCLRLMRDDSGCMSRLLHEAENGRMHLMIWMQLSKPSLFERFVVTMVQGTFFNFYALFDLISPRTAHRMVGYLEEEAIVSYTAFLEETDAGRIDNLPAPQVAISYYNLANDARLRDVVLAVRADEAAHRDANHHFSDRIAMKSENLQEPLH